MQASTTRVAAVLAAAALSLAITACAKDSTTGSPAPSPTPSSGITTSVVPVSSAAVAQKPGLSPQGFLPKNIGQLAGLDCTGNVIDTCGIKFQVTGIDTNPQCHQYGKAADAGRKTLLLHVSLTTGTLSSDGATFAPMIFNPFSLKGISPDGFVHDAKPGNCTDYDGRLTNTILPNARYEGTVEVEIPESVTSIASATQPTAADGNRGWVWPVS